MRVLDGQRHRAPRICAAGRDSLDSALYVQQLARVDAKLQALNHGRVRLLHDNARPHVSKLTRAEINKLGWETLPHAPYSPDMAPSDFWMFGALQRHLDGQSFNTVAEVEDGVQVFFDSKPTEWFHRGIHKLPEIWENIVYL